MISNATTTTIALNTKEDAVNKSTTTSLGTSDVLFPTQNAVKTYVDNQVTNGIVTNVSGIVAITNGGTGSSVQNFVDLTTNQAIGGNKSFNSDINVSGLRVGNGGGSQSTIIGDTANGNQPNNTAIGFMTLDGNSGANNTAIGTNSMRNSGDTSMNTSIGVNSGTGVNNGIGNTYLGSNANVTNNSAISNATALGAGAIVLASNTVQLGNTSITDVKTSGKLTTGTITLPNTDGTLGQVLTTNGSGIVDWNSPTSISISPINGNSDVNGATIINGVLSLNPADATNGGVVTSGTQTFAGNKTILGSLTVSSENSVPVLDQSHSVYYGGYGGGQTALGQSFTAGLSGILNKVSMKFLNSTCTGVLKIFSGSGITGSLLTSQSFSLSSGSGDIEFTLNSPVTIVNGTIYTMLFEITSGNIDVGNSNDGSYTGGQAYAWGGLQSNVDNVFKTYISTLSGGNITINGKLTAGNITLPNTDGTSGQVLTTNGAGVVGWTTPAGPSATALLGVVPMANGGTGATTAAGALTNLGAAPIASPTFSGIPAAPTATAGTNTTQLATTAFVASALSGYSGNLSAYTSTINNIYNVGLGISTPIATIGQFNTAIGGYAMSHITSGTDNVVVGTQAARYYKNSGWGTNSQAMNRGVYLGSLTRPSALNTVNEIVIGYRAEGSGNNTITLGYTDITDVYTSGNIRTSNNIYAIGSLTAKSIISSGRMVMSTATIDYSELNNYNVSNVSILFVRPNSSWTNIYGLTGGVVGQIIHIYTVNNQTPNCCTGLSLWNYDSSNNDGIQKFVAPGAINIDSNKNTTLVFDGTYWRVSKLGGM